MIRLRQIEEEDLPQLRDWRNSDWLRPYVREYRLLNMVNQHEWFQYISTSRDVEMYGIAWENRLIGVCGLTNINWVNRTAEISIYVAPDMRGQGLATQALQGLDKKGFDEFGLNRLWAEIYDFNGESVHLFERCGYEFEGRMRQHVFKDGQFHDSLLYGKLQCTR